MFNRWMKSEPKELTDHTHTEIETLRKLVEEQGKVLVVLANELQKRVLISDIASMGRDVQEHGVQIEELQEELKIILTKQPEMEHINSPAEDRMLAQVAGTSVNSLKKKVPASRKKKV